MTRLSRQDVEAEYPIADLVDGWFFNLDEVSAGVYEAKGTDLWGRTVSRKGTDADKVLSASAEDARGIKARNEP